jgi:hypothetical protein
LLESRWPGAFFQPILWRRPSPVSYGVLYNSRWELFPQPPESIRFFECSFCCLADLLFRRVFRRHLKVIALGFHGHGIVSGLFGCCRVSAAIA